MCNRYPGGQAQRGRPDPGRVRVDAVCGIDHQCSVPIDRRRCPETARSRLDGGPNLRGGLHHRDVCFLQSRGRCVWRFTTKLSLPWEHDAVAQDRLSHARGCYSFPLVFFDYCAWLIKEIALSPLNASCGGTLVGQWNPAWGRAVNGWGSISCC